MSSDPFKLLGLDRATATDADVRRAYAERLKVTRPEDDRDGFMALRDAFERARQSVRWRDQYGDEDEDEDDAGDSERGYITLTPVPLPGEAAEVVDYNAEMAAGGTFEPQTADADDAYEDDYEEPPPDPFDVRVGETMDRLIDVLTSGPFGARGKDVMVVLDHPDVAGIEEFQALQWRVRQFLCDRTGYNGEPQALRTPDWLTADVFRTLDEYFGWTRQPVTQSWLRQQNDWLVRVRKQIDWEALPAAQRKQVELADKQAEKKGGGLIWLWVGAGILIVQVIRALTGNGG